VGIFGRRHRETSCERPGRVPVNRSQDALGVRPLRRNVARRSPRSGAQAERRGRSLGSFPTHPPCEHHRCGARRHGVRLSLVLNADVPIEVYAVNFQVIPARRGTYIGHILSRTLRIREAAPGGGVPRVQLLDCAGLHPSEIGPRRRNAAITRAGGRSPAEDAETCAGRSSRPRCVHRIPQAP
jgi:hypothetical protein